MADKTITDFLNNEYKEFAMYTIQNRAIPSVIDGFKISQRKVIHIANKIWKNDSGKSIKIFQLAGKVASDSFYHHGNQSLETTIVNLAQKFKNNVPLLEEDGQFGSLRSPESGATRYIGTKLSENFRLLYKDFDLLELKKEEGEIIEPYYFLPIIPIVLLNGSSGIAVGFRCNILSRNLFDIINSCRRSVKNIKTPTEIKIQIPEYEGEVKRDVENKNKWIFTGKFRRIGDNKIKITELPPSMTYEKYDDILEGLIEKRIVKSYEDNCKNDVNYVITFFEKIKNKKNEDIISLLKLKESQTEYFTLLDENNNLTIFDSEHQIIDHFVKFRLKYYEKKKKYLIKKKEDGIFLIKNKIKFVEGILNNKIIINNKSKSEINKQIEKEKISKINRSYDYLLNMPIYSLSKNLYDELKKQNEKNEIYLKTLKKKKSKDFYLEDLNNIEKHFKNNT